MSIATLKPVGRLRVTQPRVVLSEWTKLRSLRSTLWSFLVAVLLGIGLPCLFAAVISSRWGSLTLQERAHRRPFHVVLVGVSIAELAIAVLGVLVITGEYSTGMIRSTFCAVPKRLPVLWAKVAVFGVATFVLMLPTVVAAFFASQAIFARHDILQVSFSAPGVTRALIGGALYLTVLGVFCLGLGAIVRNTAGAIAVYAGIFFVVPPLLGVLPSSWDNAISPYLPGAAGHDVFALATRPNSLGVWTGFALFCGYALASLAIAAVLLIRRDA